jgi:hypothetical protein
MANVFSKQLDSDGQLKPGTAPQCGGFSPIEAEREKRVGCVVLRSGHQAGGACARPPFTAQAKSKKRTQFRVASRNITALYEAVEAVEV